MASTRIVEIPIDSHIAEATSSLELESYSVSEPSEIEELFKTTSSPSNKQQPGATTTRPEENLPVGLFEDFNNFCSEEDIFSSLDFSWPESPSMSELRSGFDSLRRPSIDEENKGTPSGPLQAPTMTEEREKKAVVLVESIPHQLTSPPPALTSFESEESQSSSSEDEDEEKRQYGGKTRPKEKDFDKMMDDDDEIKAIKKRVKLGVTKHDSFSSITSFSSDSESEESDEDADVSDSLSEEDEEDSEAEDGNPDKSLKNSLPLLRKYKLPASLRAWDLIIGSWSLKSSTHVDPLIETLQGQSMADLTFDVKILFGRKKLKYEMCTLDRNPKSKTVLMMDFHIQSITALSVKPEIGEIVLVLSEPPVFTKKERGKSTRTLDYTDGNALEYQKHRIIIQDKQQIPEFLERLYSCDKRLRQLSKISSIPADEPKFPKDRVHTRTTTFVPICEWDKENKATKYCEECKANYCQVCDDVIHRHSTHKKHRRVAVIVKPITPPKKKPSCKKRKKATADRCRCGTGATKGTLGEPCTGNRCPCFSNGKSCVTCGCKNCANPIKFNKSSTPNSLSAHLLKNVLDRTTRSGLKKSFSADTI